MPEYLVTVQLVPTDPATNLERLAAEVRAWALDGDDLAVENWGGCYPTLQLAGPVDVVAAAHIAFRDRLGLRPAHVAVGRRRDDPNDRADYLAAVHRAHATQA